MRGISGQRPITDYHLKVIDFSTIDLPERCLCQMWALGAQLRGMEEIVREALAWDERMGAGWTLLKSITGEGWKRNENCERLEEIRRAGSEEERRWVDNFELEIAEGHKLVIEKVKRITKPRVK